MEGMQKKLAYAHLRSQRNIRLLEEVEHHQ